SAPAAAGRTGPTTDAAVAGAAPRRGVLLYPPAAQADAGVVEHGGLPGRDRALGLVELDRDAPLGQRPERGRRFGVAIADLDAGLEVGAGGRAGDPVDVARGQSPGLQLPGLAGDPRAGLRPQGQYIKRTGARDAQPPPLADREAVDPVVAAQDAPGAVHHRPRAVLGRGVAID